MHSSLEHFLKFFDHIFLKQIISTEYKVNFMLCKNSHQVTNCIMPKKQCPGYDTKQSDGEVPVILELWGMQSIPSLS